MLKKSFVLANLTAAASASRGISEWNDAVQAIEDRSEVADSNIIDEFIDWAYETGRDEDYILDGSDNFNDIILRYEHYYASINYINELNARDDGVSYGHTIFDDMADAEKILYTNKDVSLDNNDEKESINDNESSSDEKGDDDDDDDFEALHHMRRYLLQLTGFKSTLKTINTISGQRESFNSDLRPYLPPVKNQGSCGSCYVFSATCQFEGNYNFYQSQLGNSKIEKFSEQWALSCLSENRKCRGGLPKNINDRYKYYGACKNNFYDTYAADENLQTCHSDYCKDGRIVAQDTYFLNIANSYNLFKQTVKLVSQNVATTVGMSLPKRFYNFRGQSSILYNCETNELNHAMTIVGQYKSDTDGKDYLIIRNSWSKNWGDNGYFYMSEDAAQSCKYNHITWNDFPPVQIISETSNPTPVPTKNPIDIEQEQTSNPTQVPTKEPTKEEGDDDDDDDDDDNKECNECNDRIEPCNRENEYDNNIFGCNFHTNENCEIFDKEFGGCKKCKNGYFMKNKHYPCVECSGAIPGCQECSDYVGCTKCECDEFEIGFDEKCGISRCKPTGEDDYGCTVM